MVYSSHAGIPAATGAMSSDSYGNDAYMKTGDGSFWTGICTIRINAGNSNPIYSGNTIQPSAVQALMIIKI